MRLFALIFCAGVLAGSAIGQAVRTVPIGEAFRAAEANEQVDVYGIMTAEIAPGFYFLQDASGALRVNLRNPIPVKVGDEMRVRIAKYDGRPGHGGWFITKDAEVLRPGALPVPELIRADTATIPEHDSKYITLRGRVVGHTEFKSKYWINLKWYTLTYDVLITECDGIAVQIAFFPDSTVRERFPIGTKAEFTGVCRLFIERNVTEKREMYLNVSGPDQVRVLELPPPPPASMKKSVLWSIYGGIGAVVAAGAWMLWRSRRARIASERLQRVNTELEERVAERTAELCSSNESLRKSQAQLSRALEQQMEHLRLKTNFVSLVSHEFRTPLEVIASSSFNLDRYHDRLPPEKRGELVATIQGSVRHMAGMMEQVLFLGRLEPGRVQYDPVPFDLLVFCRRMTDEIESATSGRCPVLYEFGAGLEGAAGDQAVLSHIFTNVLSNAVKYSPPGAKVKFSVIREGDEARFVISDSGCGIPVADQPKLFEAFYRGSNVENIPGTGLGLVIVRRCLEVHGGRMTFDSAEEMGTTVTIHIPLFAPVAVRV